MAENTTTYTLQAKEFVSDALAKVLSLFKLVQQEGSKGTPLPGLDKAADDAKRVADNVRKIGDNAQAAKGFVAKMTEQVQANARSLESIGKLLQQAKGAVGIAEAGFGVLKTFGAALRGDAAAAEEATQQAVDAFRQIPVVGEPALAVAKGLADAFSGIKNAIGGKGLIGDGALAARTLKEAEAVDRYTDSLKARLQVEDQVRDLMAAVVQDSRGRFDQQFLTQQDRDLKSLAELKRQRDELLRFQPFSDRNGVLTGTGEAVKRETDRAFTVLGERYKQIYIAKAIQAEGELAEARLQLNDRTAEADRIAFVQSLADKQKAASEVSARVGQIQEKINTALLQNFDRQAKQARDRLIQSLDADLTQRTLRAQGTLAAAQAADRVALSLKQQLELIDSVAKLRGGGVDETSVQATANLIRRTQELERQAQLRDQAFGRGGDEIDKLRDKQGDLNAVIDRSNFLYDEGRITLAEATRQQRAAIDAVREQVTTVSGDIDGLLASGILSEQQADELKRRLREVRDEADRTKDATQRIAEGLQRDTSSAISDFALTSIKNFHSIGDAAANLLDQVSTRILRIFTDQIGTNVANAFTGGQGAGGGLFGGIVGSITKLFGFASGGLVPGAGPGHVDSVPAILAPGEFVVPAAAVRRLGVDFLDTLSGRRHLHPLPSPALAAPQRLATGGPVATPGGRDKPALATVIASNQEADRFFRGGHTAIVRYFSQHAALYRSIFGGPA